ncbi:CheR family methyltransferase [Pseudoponticoccus marisrubri]|uniref:Chemotaxis protein methyltransferase n=1 Tax=Pseudoponticoccus marisrubri TaxID=1685382 RepID=A0A0W7WQD2_9RHOB|nr:protein-glutamate O-methyltransferase [Pseudoponticoccus marisrubri]KUF12818.1 chemotaxis protein [Pseudoponticoccus marisrubri]
MSTGIETGDMIFSDSDYRALAALARRNYGLNLADSKKPLVHSRLSRRLKARRVAGFKEYLTLLQDRAEEAERLELISALTTNVTSFFREKHHFDILTAHLRDHVAARGRIRIWSAGCSSGQEPCSIVMTALAGGLDPGQTDFKVLATDIDPKIVEKARTGTFTEDELSGLSPDDRKRWLDRSGIDPKAWQMSPSILSHIAFAELNLISQWPFSGPFSAIFCRNVAIYFDQPTQQTLWARLCDILEPGGLLFIGHSERVTGLATRQLKPVGITTYQKIDAASALSPTEE